MKEYFVISGNETSGSPMLLYIIYCLLHLNKAKLSV
jgi:hypothetical protein